MFLWLVSTYGLKSTNNVSSIESFAIFMWIAEEPQSFSQVEYYFARSLSTIHTNFHEVLIKLFVQVSKRQYETKRSYFQ